MFSFDVIFSCKLTRASLTLSCAIDTLVSVVAKSAISPDEPRVEELPNESEEEEEKELADVLPKKKSTAAAAVYDSSSTANNATTATAANEIDWRRKKKKKRLLEIIVNGIGSEIRILKCYIIG